MKLAQDCCAETFSRITVIRPTRPETQLELRFHGLSDMDGLLKRSPPIARLLRVRQRSSQHDP